MMLYTGYPYVLVSKIDFIFFGREDQSLISTECGYLAQNFSALFMAHCIQLHMYNYNSQESISL